MRHKYEPVDRTDKLLSKEIEELSEEELCAIVGAGQQAGLKLYPFKK